MTKLLMSIFIILLLMFFLVPPSSAQPNDYVYSMNKTSLEWEEQRLLEFINSSSPPNANPFKFGYTGEKTSLHFPIGCNITISEALKRCFFSDPLQVNMTVNVIQLMEVVSEHSRVVSK